MSRTEEIIKDQERIYAELCRLSDEFDEKGEILCDDILLFAKKRNKLMRNYRTNQDNLKPNERELLKFTYFKDNIYKRIELEFNFFKQKIVNKLHKCDLEYPDEDPEHLIRPEVEKFSDASTSEEKRAFEAEKPKKRQNEEEDGEKRPPSEGGDSTSEHLPEVKLHKSIQRELCDASTSTDHLGAALKFQATAFLFEDEIDKVASYLFDGLKPRARAVTELLKEGYQSLQNDLQLVYCNQCDGIEECKEKFNELREKYDILLECIDEEETLDEATEPIPELELELTPASIPSKFNAVTILQHLLFWWLVMTIMCILHIEPNYLILFVLHICSLIFTLHNCYR